MDALQKARETFEHAQQEVVQARIPDTSLDKLMQEAPLPVMPVPQVNMNQVKSLEALTNMIEKHVEFRVRPTTRPTDSCNPRVAGNSAHEGGCSFGSRGGRRAGPRALGPGRGRCRGDGRRGAHAPGGPPVEPRQTRKAAACASH